MKTVKWHKGIENMLNKRDAKLGASTFIDVDVFLATKSNFILLAKRSDSLDNWKSAVKSVVKKSDVEEAINILGNGSPFAVTKPELRRAADLV